MQIGQRGAMSSIDGLERRQLEILALFVLRRRGADDDIIARKQALIGQQRRLNACDPSVTGKGEDVVVVDVRVLSLTASVGLADELQIVLTLGQLRLVTAVGDRGEEQSAGSQEDACGDDHVRQRPATGLAVVFGLRRTGDALTGRRDFLGGGDLFENTTAGSRGEPHRRGVNRATAIERLESLGENFSLRGKLGVLRHLALELFVFERL